MNFTHPSTELGAPPKRGYGEDDLILASGCCHRLIILKKTLEKNLKQEIRTLPGANIVVVTFLFSGFADSKSTAKYLNLRARLAPII
jgi:hypothetical protein